MRKTITKRYGIQVLGGFAEISRGGVHHVVNPGDTIYINVKLTWSTSNWRTRLYCWFTGVKVRFEEDEFGVSLVSK